MLRRPSPSMRCATLVVVLTACGAQRGAVRTAEMDPARASGPRASEVARPAPPPHVELQATMDGVCELADGVVRCAGRNMWGEVGDGAREPHREWNRVPGTEGAVQLAAGGHHVCVRIDAGVAHTCARVRGGDVLCWGGRIDSVQLGFDLDPASRLHPTRIAMDVSRLVTGNERTFARTHDGWQTWIPTRGSPPIPRSLDALDDAVELAAGFDFTCARLRTGQVKCWGSAEYLPEETAILAFDGAVQR